MDSYVDLDVLLNLLDDSIKQQVQNVYLLGSRLYGTSNEFSDWDITVVVSASQAHMERSKIFYHTHKNQQVMLDVTLVTIEEFQSTFSKYFCIEEMLIIWLPSHCIWMEKCPPPRNCQFNRNTLFNSFKQQILRVLKLSREYCLECVNIPVMVPQGRKLCSIALIYCEFARQILQLGEITNFSTGPMNSKKLVLEEYGHVDALELHSKVIEPLVLQKLQEMEQPSNVAL